jgi:hypothetical protein
MKKPVATARNLALSLGFCFLSAPPAASENIPLGQSGGVYTIPVRINDAITIPFVLDSGAAEVAIPVDVFRTLTRTGTVHLTDQVGRGKYTLADGSIISADRFRIYKMVVGNYAIPNVIVNITQVQGDPLLGQSFLSRLPSWSIDNAHHVMILGDVGTATSSVFDGRWVADIPSQGNCFYPSRMNLEVRGSLISGNVTAAGKSYPITGSIDGAGNGIIVINESLANSGSIRFATGTFVADYMNGACGPRHAMGTRG